MVDRYHKISPVAVFYAYAHEDEPLREQLENHLRLLSRQGLISEWHDHQILPGAVWAQEIDAHLNSASIILLLISSNFLASDYCYGVEMQRALERHSRGEARVIPIFLRPVDWESAPFAHLQGLPRNGKPVTEWNNQDAAFRNIARELRRTLDQIGTIAHSASTEKDNRAFLLKEVRTRWIEGVLLNSLHHEVLIQLGLHEHPSAVANPWSLMVRETNLPERPLADGTRIHEVYDRADGQVLILGEPGAGKTNLLLQLARKLLTRASEDESHRMPVIFNLSSWSINHLPLAEWLIEELHERYHIPPMIAQSWITYEQIIPLLDGLDEVAGEKREACISAINTYRQAHHLIPLVICCRKTEYDVLSSRLELHTAVIIQPLPLQDVDRYCEQMGESVTALRQALHQERPPRARHHATYALYSGACLPRIILDRAPPKVVIGAIAATDLCSVYWTYANTPRQICPLYRRADGPLALLASQAVAASGSDRILSRISPFALVYYTTDTLHLQCDYSLIR